MFIIVDARKTPPLSMANIYSRLSKSAISLNSYGAKNENEKCSKNYLIM